MGEEYDEHATYLLGSVFSTFSANPLHHPGLSFGGFLAETIPFTTEQIHRHLTSTLSSALGHNAQLTYSLCDSNHVLQARLSANGHLRPSRNERIMEVNCQPFNKRTSSRTFTPALDLYYHQDFRRHQALTANVVATYLKSTGHVENNEDGAYAYDTDGRTSSLWSEAIYENRLQPFSLSTGLQFNLHRSHNVYEGDVCATNQLHTTGYVPFHPVAGPALQAQIHGGPGHQPAPLQSRKQPSGLLALPPKMRHRLCSHRTCPPALCL